MRLLIKINKQQDNNITNRIIENIKGEIKVTLEKFCLDLIKNQSASFIQSEVAFISGIDRYCNGR